jgi:hypothetical protein
MAHELDYLGMRNGERSIDAIVSGQELMAASAVAYKQLSRYEFVPYDLVRGKQVTQLLGVGIPIGQKPDPNGRVDQNHLGRRCRDIRVFAAPRYVFGFGFAPAKTSEALVSRASHQSLKTQTNGLCVGGCSTRGLRRIEEFILYV